jgi:hypothetical protein
MDINIPGRISKLNVTHECAAFEISPAIECAMGLICIDVSIPNKSIC